MFSVSGIALCATFFATVANAHFQLAFPPPRGVFVEDSEPSFCDGYTSVNNTRTEFPLSGGFFTLNSEHPAWTSTVLLSTDANPTAFANFSQILPFFKVNGEGVFCIPLDLSKSNATGLTNGLNVTVQILFDGGDGELFQCADLTLTNNATIESGVSCTNATGSAANATSTSPASAATTSSSTTNGDKKNSQFPLVGSLIASVLMMAAGLL